MFFNTQYMKINWKKLFYNFYKYTMFHWEQNEKLKSKSLFTKNKTENVCKKTEKWGKSHLEVFIVRSVID